jgi:hypothetical protein
MVSRPARPRRFVDPADPSASEDQVLNLLSRPAEAVQVALPSMDEPGRSGEKTFAERLDLLIRTVRPAGRGEYTYEELSAAISSRGGPTISGSYIFIGSEVLVLPRLTPLTPRSGRSHGVQC